MSAADAVSAADAAISAWVQAASSVILVVVTTVYVVLTSRMAKATQASASASVRAADAATEGTSTGRTVAEEAALQRRAASQPLPTIEEGTFEWYGRRVNALEVSLMNYGAGPGFGVVVWFYSRGSAPLNVALSRALAPLNREVVRLEFDGGTTWDVLSDLSCWVSCQDLFGNEYSWRQSVVPHSDKGRLSVVAPPVTSNRPDQVQDQNETPNTSGSS